VSEPRRLSRHRFPVDPWRLIETELGLDDLGHTETLFAVGNGYIGMRANPEEGRDAHSHGTFLNGFHETWHIRHAEEAYGFAKTGQTIVNVPDAKLIKLYVDDEPLLLSSADLDEYERVLDFSAGRLSRSLVWRTPAGKRVRVTSTRMASFTHRHLVLLTFDVTLLDEAAPVVISSQLMNRQDGEDEYHVTAAALGEGLDPRRSRRFDHRVLEPILQRHDPVADDQGEVVLGYRCANSRMTMACGYRHLVDTACGYRVDTQVHDDIAKTVFTVRAEPGQTFRLVKLVSYHTSTGVPAQELADRCSRTLERAVVDGVDAVVSEQAAWLTTFWEASDVEIHGDEAAQQAMRWNLYQLAQASARTQEQGIAAKGVTGAGYEGHYFWDTEIYVLPFLAYTSPDIARKLLRVRWAMLPTARQRAVDLNGAGAMYPWRTINGEEASAYYAAGTAQYHINAAIMFALKRYLDATGDIYFLADEGVEMLVETARMWEDLGFYAVNGDRVFRIHGVTGPDEYTTVVNDNLYTNVMARFNLRYAARSVELLAEWNEQAYERLVRRVGLGDDETKRWNEAAQAMYIPYDERLGIHPQDDNFLDRESWDFEHTPPDRYPLLLHYHPLVIYRHQVLKQADVVLAMVLRGEHFSLEQKRRNFDYYDPITTGDSSLSACVQAVAAAQIGYDELALDYFREALYVDLADEHGNTADGVHIASAGGVWGSLVFGFAGMYDNGVALRFAPSLPTGWDGFSFRVARHGSRMRVDVDTEGCLVAVLDGPPVPLVDDDETVRVEAGESYRIPFRSYAATPGAPHPDDMDIA
jgi:alpha,alpha-trehalose phosphorylase